MTDLYDIHLFEKSTGRYSGTQNCLLEYDTEKFHMTTVEPPESHCRGTDWWYPIDWPYWSGSEWYLKEQDPGGA
jgi:hypothetical protein